MSHTSWTLDDLATSANAIRQQQAALGHWAKDALPNGTTIGVNDTGAIGYFSGRRIFDVVGLTTRGEARYWVAGAGSRFEHYERLGAARLPATFIVYPEWFALPALLGEYRTERRVPGATILGGETMVAAEADYSRLGSGALPVVKVHDPALLLDELDVADLESEGTHRYALFEATSAENVAVERGALVDGARTRRVRERFELRLAAGGRLVARLGSEGDTEISVRAAGTPLGTWQLVAVGAEELELEVPARVENAPVTVELEARAGSFSALHYWSYRPAP